MVCGYCLFVLISRQIFASRLLLVAAPGGFRPLYLIIAAILGVREEAAAGE
jgi:hypothetical protein